MTHHSARQYLIDENKKIKDEQVIFFLTTQ
jgi:hypothetical protein